MSKEDCEKFIHNYFKRFPKVEKWIAKTKRYAKIHKQVSTLTGRIRHLEAIDSVERSIASQAIRQSINTPIQSSGSDCTLMSMIKMNEWLKQTNKRTKMCITVHDSIVFDCPIDETIEVAKKVKHIMENLAEYNEFYKFLGEVPIIAELEIGYDYGTSFECTVEDLEENGVIAFLDKEVAKKKAKAKKELQEGLEKGVPIPWYANIE